MTTRVIEITSADTGNSIYINPDYIISMHSDRGYSIIIVNGVDSKITVRSKDHVKEIANQINDQADNE